MSARTRSIARAPISTRAAAACDAARRSAGAARRATGGCGSAIGSGAPTARRRGDRAAPRRTPVPARLRRRTPGDPSGASHGSDDVGLALAQRVEHERDAVEVVSSASNSVGRGRDGRIAGDRRDSIRCASSPRRIAPAMRALPLNVCSVRRNSAAHGAVVRAAAPGAQLARRPAERARPLRRGRSAATVSSTSSLTSSSVSSGGIAGAEVAPAGTGAPAATLRRPGRPRRAAAADSCTGTAASPAAAASGAGAPASVVGASAPGEPDGGRARRSPRTLLVPRTTRLRTNPEPPAAPPLPARPKPSLARRPRPPAAGRASARSRSLPGAARRARCRYPPLHVRRCG